MLLCGGDQRLHAGGREALHHDHDGGHLRGQSGAQQEVHVRSKRAHAIESPLAVIHAKSSVGSKPGFDKWGSCDVWA